MRLYILAFFCFVTGVAQANVSSTVQVQKSDGRRCQGAFIASNVVATAAHCLDNFYDGGLTWNGNRSREAYVADSVRKRGSASNDDDFALLIFGGSHRFASPDFSRQRIGARVTIGTYRAGSLRTYSETISSYTSNSSQTADVFVATGNGPGLSQGDSGAPLFSASGQYLGALRGCVPGMCGFFGVHAGNPVATEVFRKIRSRHPNLFSQNATPSPRPPVQPRPPIQNRRYSCQAQCRIEYRNPYNVATESVRAILISASSPGEAASKGRTELERNCNEYCIFSRDAFRCTLSSSIRCQ